MNSTFFAENQLADGQPLIETTNLKRTHMFLRLLMDPERPTPTMGVITGLAGVGKTIATQEYIAHVAPNTQTTLPMAIKVTVRARSTPRALAKNVLDGLQEKAKGSNIYEIGDDAAEAMDRNDLKLLLVDEADRLNEDSFEVLRHLFDKTGCPIVLVGLPTILSVINRHEKFRSRVGLRLSFVPLEEQEILTVVLPQLVIPRWVYCAENEDDQKMGKAIWKKVKPSLRNLTNLLSTASLFAKAYQSPAITAAHIQEAFVWVNTQKERQQTRQKTDKETQGTHEKESEKRHGKQPPPPDENPAA